MNPELTIGDRRLAPFRWRNAVQLCRRSKKEAFLLSLTPLAASASYPSDEEKGDLTMKIEFYIYAIVTGQEVTFIGCTKGDVPAGAIRLQTVSEHPKANWVKWCVRFRRTLKDRHGIEDPLAQIFSNSFRVKRLLDADAVMRAEAEMCKAFLAFHARNPHVLAEIIEQARAEKAAGRRVYAIEAQICNVRWSSDIDTERSDDSFKIANGWAAWYSRLIQMECPDLIGFFRLKTAIADGLVVDGRSWRDFAKEHADELHYDDFESLADSEWEYNG